MQNHNAIHAILDFEIITLNKSRRYNSELQLIVLIFNILNNNFTRLKFDQFLQNSGYLVKCDWETSFIFLPNQR
jgi:hypothetical protein